MAADLRWRAPARYAGWRRRACQYLSRLLESPGDRGGHVAELMHLLDQRHQPGTQVPGMRSPASAGIAIRDARSGDQPAVADLCRRGAAPSGAAAGQLLRELAADFPLAAAAGTFVLAVEETGAPVAYGYAIPLTAATCELAAASRAAYFSALPALELAELSTAADDCPPAVLLGHSVHLPGRDQDAFAVGREVFVRLAAGFPRAGRVCTLVAADSVVVPYIEKGGSGAGSPGSPGTRAGACSMSGCATTAPAVLPPGRSGSWSRRARHVTSTRSARPRSGRR